MSVASPTLISGNKIKGAGDDDNHKVEGEASNHEFTNQKVTSWLSFYMQLYSNLVSP